MKLIHENLSRLKILVVFFIIVLESILFFIMLKLYNPIYIKTFDITKNYTINKTIYASKTLNDILKLELYRYLFDLRLIGKHMSFLGNIDDNSKFMNK